MRFDWDDNNVKHIARHGISVETAEAVLSSDDVVIKPVDSLRFVAEATVGGKLYCVVAAVSGEDSVYVITAHRVSKRRRT